MLSAKDIALLALALFLVALTIFVSLMLARLAGVLRSTQTLVSGVADRTVPLLGEVTTSVVHVNAELERVDAITANVQAITTNVSSLAALFAATLGSPLVKVAAFSYGVRRAASKRTQDDLEDRIKEQMKAERRTSKAARKAAKRGGA
jgi:uncharacterized protein YoxC